MNVLAIETSTAVCSVAVIADQRSVVERSVVEAHIHSEKLLTLVNDVLTESRIGMGKLDGIAVSIGPGSFTGLRIGLSSAKGLCTAIEKPLATVPTFDSIASSVRARHPGKEDVVIALDARQGEYYVARYSNRSGLESCEDPVAVVSAEHLAGVVSQLGSATIVTDRPDRLSPSVHGSTRLLNFTEYCHASTIAHLGLRKLLAGDHADVAAVEPMYLKDFVIRTPVQHV
jgi:tRNA threonylcarbamoyladenosine biosynthesis protein TsaB